MEDQKQTSFKFEIDNFSEKVDMISSPNFISGDYEWFVSVCPKGSYIKNSLTLFLNFSNRESLQLGLKIRASFSFELLNQSGKVLYRTDEAPNLFFVRFPRWADSANLQFLQRKGVFAKNKLILIVKVKVIEVDEGDVTEDEMFVVAGFQVLCPQVRSVRLLFRKHPDFAVNFRLTNQVVRTAYINVLLGLIDTLNKPPHSLSDTELKNARSELMELTNAGFKLDWVKTMFNEVALERKKENANGSRVKEREKQLTRLNNEFNKEKVKSTTSAARDWLKGVVHSWNEWKGRVGFADHLRYEKIPLLRPGEY